MWIFIGIVALIGAIFGHFVGYELVSGTKDSLKSKIGWYTLMVLICSTGAVSGVFAIAALFILMIAFMGLAVITTFFSALSDVGRRIT